MDLSEFEQEFGDVVEAEPQDVVNSDNQNSTIDTEQEVEEKPKKKKLKKPALANRRVKDKKVIGSKREVWNGTAERTSGGLRKDDLMKNKRGRIVSKKKHELGKTAFKKNKLTPNMQLSNE